MPGVKRSQAQILGRRRARETAASLGDAIRISRRRRRLSQEALARLVGISRQRLGDLENGNGYSAPAETWFAIAEALGRYLKFEFARDPLQAPADAGHLEVQEVVLAVAQPAGWTGGFELPTRPTDPARSVDVPLLDLNQRRLAIVECWNTFGDIGGATRSSNRKLAEADQLAVVKGASSGDGSPVRIGLCWVVRDSIANRELVNRYEHIFAARFPGSSAGWVKALTVRGAPMPDQAGLIWCDPRTGRLFARRQPNQTERQPDQPKRGGR